MQEFIVAPWSMAGTAGPTSLDEFTTNESAQKAVAAAWDRANQRMVEFIRSSDQFKRQTVGQEDGPDLDAQTALIDVVSQPMSQSSVLEMIKDHTRMRDDQWSDISDTLKERLAEESWTNLVQAQEKYNIRDHF